MKTPPSYLVRELKLINPMYFAVYNTTNGRWEIRKWTGRYPRKKTWEINSELIYTICKRDEYEQDIGYLDFDMRSIERMKEGFYWARKIKELIQKVDAANAKKLENADIEDTYIARYMAKSIYHHYREPTVIGGVTGGDRPWKY